MACRPNLILRPALVLVALLAGAGGAAAQIVLPGAQLPAAAGEAAVPNPAAGAAGAEPAGRLAPAAPARPLAAKAAAEEAIVNRVLKLNGRVGQLRVERASRSELKAVVVLEGTRISAPAETCEVRVAEPVLLTPRGRPEGLARYELAVPACPIAADLVDGALWVRGSAPACLVEAADCRIDPRGLWGPEPAALVALARPIEQDRSQADRTVRENYKALAQRAKPHEVRTVVSEQAAFSAERETLCRSYAREAAHGFCNARFTEARAAELAARLGLAAAVTAAPRRAPAPRPPAPAPLSLMPN